MNKLKLKKKPWDPFSRLFLCVIFLSFFIPAPLCASTYSYEWTPALKQAFEEIQELKLEAAQDLLVAEKKRLPNNLVITYLEDYIFFYTYFITEDLDAFQQIKSSKEIRLDVLEKGPNDQPEYLQFQAEVLIHWALVHAKFESYFTSAQEINRAFKMLKKNEKKFPGHMASRRMLSTLRAGVGTLPKKYKWIVKLLSSLEGSVIEGVEGLESVVEYSHVHPEFVYKNESRMLYALVLTHFVSDPEQSYQVIKNPNGRAEISPLMRFTIANMAQASGKNEDVIELLSGYQVAEGALPIHYLDYMLGIAKLYRNDPDADEPLLTYIREFNGRHYIKESYQKLAWHALINDRSSGYDKYIQLALSEGNAVIDEDKQAMLEAKEQRIPHPVLLKARLLFDGGYYQKAKEVLEAIAEGQLSFSQQLEYDYRLGRINQEMGHDVQALGAYQKTIMKGKDSPYYFACNAALQSGLIYEEFDLTGRAQEFFLLCLSMDPETYQNSLHQKAKTGLNRLKSRRK